MMPPPAFPLYQAAQDPRWLVADSGPFQRTLVYRPSPNAGVNQADQAFNPRAYHEAIQCMATTPMPQSPPAHEYYTSRVPSSAMAYHPANQTAPLGLQLPLASTRHAVEGGYRVRWPADPYRSPSSPIRRKRSIGVDGQVGSPSPTRPRHSPCQSQRDGFPPVVDPEVERQTRLFADLAKAGKGRTRSSDEIEAIIAQSAGRTAVLWLCKTAKARYSHVVKVGGKLYGRKSQDEFKCMFCIEKPQTVTTGANFRDHMCRIHNLVPPHERDEHKKCGQCGRWYQPRNGKGCGEGRRNCKPPGQGSLWKESAHPYLSSPPESWTPEEALSAATIFSLVQYLPEGGTFNRDYRYKVWEVVKREHYELGDQEDLVLPVPVSRCMGLGPRAAHDGTASQAPAWNSRTPESTAGSSKRFGQLCNMLRNEQRHAIAARSSSTPERATNDQALVPLNVTHGAAGDSQGALYDGNAHYQSQTAIFTRPQPMHVHFEAESMLPASKTLSYDFYSLGEDAGHAVEHMDHTQLAGTERLQGLGLDAGASADSNVENSHSMVVDPHFYSDAQSKLPAPQIFGNEFYPLDEDAGLVVGDIGRVHREGTEDLQHRGLHVGVNADSNVEDGGSMEVELDLSTTAQPVLPAFEKMDNLYNGPAVPTNFDLYVPDLDEFKAIMAESDARIWSK